MSVSEQLKIDMTTIKDNNTLLLINFEMLNNLLISKINIIFFQNNYNCILLL